MKKERGFSLAEMMIVLLIVSVTAAATAPMLNKKTQGEASEKSPWSWVNGLSVFYNKAGDANQTVSFGSLNKPNGENARVYIDSPASRPHITFGENGANPLRLFASNNYFILSNTFTNATGQVDTIAIGQTGNPIVNGSMAVGFGNVRTNGLNSIAIGSSRALDEGSIAIGTNNTATGNNAAGSVAIGHNARVAALANGGNGSSVSIGDSSVARGAGSIAIGNPNVTNSNSIVIGNYSDAQSNSGVVAIGSSNAVTGQNSIALGNGAVASAQNAISIGSVGSMHNGSNNSIVIGTNAILSVHSVTGNAALPVINAISIGSSASARCDNAIAIGREAKVFLGDIAIGAEAEASNARSIAIGNGVKAYMPDSVAIGNGAVANYSNMIVLGGSGHTTYIPGDLIVNGNVVLGHSDSSNVQLRMYGTERPMGLKDDGKDNVWVYESSPNYIHPSADSFSGLFSSDRRLKNVGESFKAGLEEIKKLEVFHYTFKKDPAKTARVGVMAQDLQKIFPDAVFKGEDGFLRIRMEDMFYAVVNAVKEINIRANEQNKKLTELNKQNKELQKRAIKLKKRINKLAKSKNNINEDNIS